MEGRNLDFMDLKLIPGQVFQLEFEGYTSDRDRSVLIGYRRGASLIVSTPIVNGVQANVKSGEKVNVRFFAGRMSCACAFQSEVMSVAKSPYPHIHLKIPDEVITGEVRGSVRADVEVVTKVDYIIKNEPKNTTAKIVDLSMHGARMIGRSFDFEEGIDLLLTFQIAITGLEHELQIKSRVRSLQDMENGVAIGLQFEDVPTEDKIALQAFVLSKVHDL
ncbi:MAG: flagellar brake protein [Bermanella sp.]